MLVINCVTGHSKYSMYHIERPSPSERPSSGKQTEQAEWKAGQPAFRVFGLSHFRRLDSADDRRVRPFSQIKNFKRDQRVEDHPQHHGNAAGHHDFHSKARSKRRTTVGIDFSAHSNRQQTEQREEPEDCERPEQDDAVDQRDQTCSSSTNVPTKSFGCRKITGLPCAPIRGSPVPVMVAPSAFILSRAA